MSVSVAGSCKPKVPWPHKEHVETHSPRGGSREVLELEARMTQDWSGGFLQTMRTLDIGIWL